MGRHEISFRRLYFAAVPVVQSLHELLIFGNGNRRPAVSPVHGSTVGRHETDSGVGTVFVFQEVGVRAPFVAVIGDGGVTGFGYFVDGAGFRKHGFFLYIENLILHVELFALCVELFFLRLLF